MNRSTWHLYAELACKSAAAFVFSFAGVALVERLRLENVGQTVFWPVYASLAYWLVIRDIRFKRPQAEPVPQACIRVRFALDDSKFGAKSERERIYRFTDKLNAALVAAGTGKYDGDEFGEGECMLFMYGTDAEAIYRTVSPLLSRASFLHGAKVELFGPGSQVALRTEEL